MSRRAAAPHRTILPDPKFGNDMLAKFINMVMERGKKSAAEKIVYGAIDRIGEKKAGAAGGEAIAVLQQALDNVKPVPGSGRGARQSAADAGDALGHRSGYRPQREIHGAPSRGGIAGGCGESRRRGPQA
jgi:hypothetical protein